MAGFLRAADHMQRVNAADHDAAYNLKMLLGECLAVALYRNTRYRQVAQRYIDLEDPAADDPVLSFVVVRAFSKLAELAPALIDWGALLRVTASLDAQPPFGNRKQVVAMLVARIAAKVRGTDLGDLFIRTLSEGGTAARIAAIRGISTGEESAPSVFYLSELATMYQNRTAPVTGASKPPSRKLLALLFGLDLDQDDAVRRWLANAKDDLRRDFHIDDFPYGYFWAQLRKEPSAEGLHNAPFIGTVKKATTANMESLAIGAACRTSCASPSRASSMRCSTTAARSSSRPRTPTRRNVIDCEAARSPLPCSTATEWRPCRTANTSSSHLPTSRS